MSAELTLISELLVKIDRGENVDIVYLRGMIETGDITAVGGWLDGQGLSVPADRSALLTDWQTRAGTQDHRPHYGPLPTSGRGIFSNGLIMLASFLAENSM